MIIGITGTDGAGKGSAVAYLVANKGYAYFSAREFILERITAQGLSTDRNQMRLTANALRAEYGDDFLVRRAYEAIDSAGTKQAVIESIRAIAEANLLKARGAILLAIDAPVLLRYERVQARRSESDQVTFEQFVAHEELEKNDPDPHGMQKAAVMEMADYTIINDGTLEELHRKLEEFLAKFHSA